MLDFNCVKKAGLTCQEAADIMGVSKVMMWKYVAGKATPRNVLFMGVDIRARATVFTAVLTKLLEKGSLPKVDLAWAPRMHPEKKERRAAVVAKLKQLVDQRVAMASANE